MQGMDAGSDRAGPLEIERRLRPVSAAVANVPLSGEIDLATVDAMFAPAYWFIAGGHRHVNLDFANVTYCDSQGLQALILLRAAVGPEGSVRLTKPSPMLLNILTITNLLDLFTVSLD